MEKRVIIGTLSVLFALALIGFVIYLVFYHEGSTNTWEDEKEVKVTALTPYGQSLAEPVTYEHWNNGRNQIQICGGDRMEEDSCHNVTAEQWNITWDNILNSDAAYLQDPGFDVTADNFYQSVRDLLMAPARLYFYSTDDQIEGSYKCDSPEIRTAFADVFQEVSLAECSEQEYSDKRTSEYNTEIFFWNVAGSFIIRCYQDYSLIGMNSYHMNTNTYTSHGFYVDENLHDKAMAAYEKLLPYSMEAPASETE